MSPNGVNEDRRFCRGALGRGAAVGPEDLEPAPARHPPGLGHDRAAELGPATARHHDIHRVVSNRGVFDFETPDHSMRLISVHPGVSVEDVIENTGFELAHDDVVPETRMPTDEELGLIRDFLDPKGLINKEIPS